METPGPVLCRVIRGLWSSSAVQPLVNIKFTLGPGRREGDREGQDDGVRGGMLCLGEVGGLLVVRWWVGTGRWGLASQIPGRTPGAG